jgi:hypothetical protein
MKIYTTAPRWPGNTLASIGSQHTYPGLTSERIFFVADYLPDPVLDGLADRRFAELNFLGRFGIKLIG